MRSRSTKRSYARLPEIIQGIVEWGADVECLWIAEWTVTLLIAAEELLALFNYNEVHGNVCQYDQ
jgi:hypothetical protein